MIIAAFSLPNTHLMAQSFDDGLELYQNQRFEEAAEIFSSMNSDRATLFAGKSYMASGNYLKAALYLNEVRESTEPALQNEALYTSALNHLHMRNWTRSLELFHEVLNREDRTGLGNTAAMQYRDLLRFIGDEERRETFFSTDNRSLRADLIATSIHHMDYDVILAMIGNMNAAGDTTIADQLRDQLGPAESYQIQTRTGRYWPEGFIYRIGVLLPSFEAGEPEFAISRNLYFGLMLAAEEFNAANSDRKVELQYRNTHSDPDSARSATQELIWTDRVDALVGPLFSAPAGEISGLAETYRVPMITPLANADEINLGHDYTYQLNPTFSLHGKNMARFAVHELGLDTLAVLTDRNSMGRASAIAFRHEAERLGAHIAYYFEDDLAAGGYDITPFTDVFTTDPALIDSLGYVPVEGLYAPFTGQASGTLANLLMNDLESKQSDMTILGSEEWLNARFPDRQLNLFEIWYSEPFGATPDSSTLAWFQEDFQSRFGVEPDRFARVGYDTGTILFNSFEQAGSPQRVRDVLKNAPPQEGLAMRIHFNGNRINQLVSIIPLSNRARNRLDEMRLETDMEQEP